VPVFVKGAHIVYAHSVLQRESGLGYLSGWAKKSFANITRRNDFFEKLGRQMQPVAEDRLRNLSPNVTPEAIFARIN
jgi:hypothetical protein